METIDIYDDKAKEALDDIGGLVDENRRNRSADQTSALDRFFWLSATKSGKDIRFYPSGLAALPQGAEGDGHWICNLVLRGGGTLGLAHIGFIAGLERAGIRFAGLAGASAGAIVATGIAAARGGDLLNQVSDALTDSTNLAPMDGFIDGPRQVRILIKHQLLGRKLYSPRVWYGLVRAWKRLMKRRALNRGDHFEQWFETEMQRFGVPTQAKLDQCLAEIYDVLAGAFADLHKNYPKCLADGRQILVTAPPGSSNQQKANALFKLITSAMPIGMKFELPEHLAYLQLPRDEISPAKLVRMSMAIPLFFDPVRVGLNREAWQTAPLLGYLKDLASDSGTSDRLDDLEELTFVDGGIFSNLPSDAFEDTLPDLPTILVPLVSENDPQKFRRDSRPSSFVKDVIASIQAMRFQRDTDTYLRLQERKKTFGHSSGPYPRSYNIATAAIPTGDADWLNFVMSQSEKRDLFAGGIKAALTFLRNVQNGTA